MVAKQNWKPIIKNKEKFFLGNKNFMNNQNYILGNNEKTLMFSKFQYIKILILVSSLFGWILTSFMISISFFGILFRFELVEITMYYKIMPIGIIVGLIFFIFSKKIRDFFYDIAYGNILNSSLNSGEGEFGAYIGIRLLFPFFIPIYFYNIIYKPNDRYFIFKKQPGMKLLNKFNKIDNFGAENEYYKLK